MPSVQITSYKPTFPGTNPVMGGTVLLPDWPQLVQYTSPAFPTTPFPSLCAASSESMDSVLLACVVVAATAYLWEGDARAVVERR